MMLSDEEIEKRAEAELEKLLAYEPEEQPENCEESEQFLFAGYEIGFWSLN